MSTKTLIRKAKKADLPMILELVKELAIYENEPEAVETSLNDYEKSFDQGLFDSHVAVLDGEIIGMTLFYDTFSTWKGKMLYLEDFVVNEKHRQTGVGTLLFEAFLAEANMRKCTLTKWQVLDWNEPAINFYKKHHAKFETKWWNVKIKLN